VRLPGTLHTLFSDAQRVQEVLIPDFASKVSLSSAADSLPPPPPHAANRTAAQAVAAIDDEWLFHSFFTQVPLDRLELENNQAFAI
jgi:hypothetical protein